MDLSKYAAHIDLVSLTQLTADSVLIEKLSDIKELTVHLEHNVKSIKGEQFVNGLVIEELKTNKTQKLDVEGIFIEIGLVPNSELLKHVVKLNEYGEIPIAAAGKPESKVFMLPAMLPMFPKNRLPLLSVKE